MACLLFFTTSCKREKLDGDKAELVGRWEWNYTWVYDKGESEIMDTLYASDYANVYEIEFIEKGIMNWYKNDKRTLHKDIKFDLVECNFPNPFGNCKR